MSTATSAPTTVIAAKDAVFNEVNRIITGLLPTVATDVKQRLEDQFKSMFSQFLEGLKKSGRSTASDVLAAGADSLSKLKKELDEAKEEIASKTKTAEKAITDALADWATQMKADPSVVQALLMLPDLAKQFQAVIDAGKQIKTQKGEITIKYTTFLSALLSLSISVMVLVSLVWSFINSL